MPAYSTHYLFAYELMRQLKDSVEFEVDEQAVYIGTQGPDLFYFHRILPWMPGKSLRKVGSMLHRSKPSVLLDTLREYIEANPTDNIAKSYAVGFILHYALDRVCHPYVYFMQYRFVELYPNMHSFTAHNMVEFGLDSYLLFSHLGVDNPARYNTEKTLNYTALTLFHCARVISYLASNTTQRFVSTTQAEQAINDLKYVQRATFDPIYNRRKLICVAQSIASPFTGNFKLSSMLRVNDMQYASKYANNRHGKWCSPYNKDVIKTDSFNDLFETSKADAIDMIKGFFNGKSTFNLTGDLSFLTGERTE